MNDMELGWLTATAMQVVGLAMALGMVGLVYERSVREKSSFMGELEHGGEIGWLALGGVVFAGGLSLTGMGWVYKGAGIALAMLLTGLAWTAPGRVGGRKSKMQVQRGVKVPLARGVVVVIFGIVVVLVLAWGMHLGYHTLHLVGLAQGLPDDVSRMDMERVVLLVEQAAGDVGAIHSDLRPLFPILNVLEGVPEVGIYLGQVDPLLSYANALARAGREIILGVEPLLGDGAGEDEELGLTERAGQVLQAGQAHFAAAAEAINRAGELRSRVNPQVLPESVRPLYMKLDDNFELLEAGVSLLQAAPQILGSDVVRKYLVLAQNRDELRATGGFISGIGLVTLNAGKILEFSLGDSYSADDFTKDYPQPPEVLHRFMLADYWVTRDANWSPDFPTSAKKAQELYALSTGVQTDGVIAFNQLAIERILQEIGPVQVPGTEEAVTAENVEAYMRQAWAPQPEEGMSEEWWLHRKDFMHQLGGVMIDHVMNTSDQEQMMDLGMVLLNLLSQGQVLLYFNDPAAQTALEKGAWDHAIEPGNSDYLYLVDSNVGFNKVDSVVERSIVYRVDLSDPNKPTGEVTVTYTHTGSGVASCKQMVSYGSGTYQDMVERCYLDYWRLYVPAGSKILSSKVQPVPGEQLLSGEDWTGNVEISQGEADTQAFAGLLMLPPSQSTQISVTYSLPEGIVHPGGEDLLEYSLVVDVQPGLDGLQIRVEVVLPINGNPLDPGDGWIKLENQIWNWEGVADSLTNLSLSFELVP